MMSGGSGKGKPGYTRFNSVGNKPGKTAFNISGDTCCIHTANIRSSVKQFNQCFAGTIMH